MMSTSDLPSLNATLNATSAVLLLAGFYFIRRHNISAHRACMIAAFCVSMAFLGSYLTYHYLHGSTRFSGAGWLRPVYFSILLSHTTLAVVNLPLVIMTIQRAWKGRFERHKRIAQWTFPIWVYVSVTGVVVYWMLYHLT